MYAEGPRAGREGVAMFEINVDLDKKCRKCKKGGATENGYCLDCIAKEIKAGRVEHSPPGLEAFVSGALGRKRPDARKE